MLLRKNYQILKSLRLSQTNFPLVKQMIYNSEKYARNLQQLRFLKTCKLLELYPNTIENLHLPQIYNSKQLYKKKLKIKQQILATTIRHLYKETNKSKKKMKEHNQLLHRYNSKPEATSIIQKCKEAYHIARIFHKQRIDKKIQHLQSKKPTTRETEVIPQIEKSELVTDLSKQLNEEEINLLSKGPKFAIKEEVKETTHYDIKASYCKLAYQIRWKSHIESQNQGISNQPPRFKENNHLNLPPTNNVSLEEKLKRTFSKIQLTIQKLPKQSSNLTRKEKATIKELKKKDLTILPSDKGTEFCAIEANKYKEAGMNHLADSTTYQRINKIQATTIERKVNSIWTKIAKRKNFQRHTITNLTARNSTIPRFYHLIKTHKTGPEIKIRPIVSNINGPTKKLAWLMTTLLTPMLTHVPAHLENSYELIQKLKSLPDNSKSTYTYPFSLDVVSLYTSIPPVEAIQATEEHLKKHQINTYGLSNEDIKEILLTITNNTYLQFENSIFRQISGLPMGGSTSGILAILYMNKLETATLNTIQTGLYKRYVDDILILTTNRDEAEKIFQTMNTVNKHIKFEIEHPDESNTLSLLDFSITINEETGEHTFNFFKKEAKKDLFVHFESALPTNNKETYIENETTRISQRCSKKEDYEKHIKKFQSILKTNGYPEATIRNNTKRKQRTTKTTKSKPEFYFEFPFINDKTDNKIKRIFKEEGLPISIYRKSYTLKQALSKKDEEICKLNNCYIRNNKICSTKNCVYEAKCIGCNEIYIGSTTRPLHIRAKEHINNKKSSIQKHKETCKNDFTFKILKKTNDAIKLRFIEAIFIKNNKPKINSKEESQELLHLIF